jgi:hydrogenase nickel incorporation protein HypA/HybF
MHELAIAGALLDVALSHGRGRRIARVGVVVGQLRQVVPSALAFCWTLATRETAAEGAALGIRSVPAAGRCRDCAAEGLLEAFPLTCPACGSADVQVTQGEELRVDWLDIEEPAEEGAHG